MKARRGASVVAAAAGGARVARVAVVGGGAAGLAAASELRLEGHDVVLYEADERGVGGVWRYDARTEDDVLAASAARETVHSSMYASLRTNLPREVMAFDGFAFTARRAGGDERRFPGHAAVQAYLAAFAQREGIADVVRLGSRVVRVAAAPGPTNATFGKRWMVDVGGPGAEPRSEGVFDACVIANGHYSEPRVPVTEGMGEFPGELCHSHNYREPSAYAGKRVVVLGASASGEDISRELATVAAEVHLSARSWQNPEWAKATEPIGPRRNLWRRANLARLHADGRVEFVDGTSVEADAVMFCTGYKYQFDFLEDGIVSIEDNCVAPLWEHLLVPGLGPSLSFIGLPWKVVPFPQFQLQARVVARALSGRIELPSSAEMAAAAFAHQETLEPVGSVPRRFAHQLGDDQFGYNDRLSALCGTEPLPRWRADMYWATGKNKRARPEEYRDSWPDEDASLLDAAVAEAEAELEVAPSPARL